MTETEVATGRMVGVIAREAGRWLALAAKARDGGWDNEAEMHALIARRKHKLAVEVRAAERLRVVAHQLVAGTYVLPSALARAIYEGSRSPCAKSKRGVAIFDSVGIGGAGNNHPPAPLTCDGSEACRAACNKVCVHAEAAALLHVAGRARGADLVHVKVVDGNPVPSGGPSCWQCSRLILEVGIAHVWLLHEDGLRRYTALEFHTLTLEHCELPAPQVPKKA